MSDLNETIRILKRRATAVNARLTAELEASDPATYETIYWLACGVTDYLLPFESENAQVDWAFDVLARVPMESGQEIGELIDERRLALSVAHREEKVRDGNYQETGE